MPSTCIFGSTARNRFDAYSDKDVLVVAPSKQAIADASRAWCAEGWSVATFTNQQISGMADRGSLFVQHLKQEAILLKDDDSFLSSLMDKYRPKSEYEDELSDSYALLRDIRLLLSNGYWPSLCSADIAYVAIRNIAIARLAAKQTYIFDYIDLINKFASEQDISTKRLDALRQLRYLKHSYRSRLMPTSPQRILEIALEGADDLFDFTGSSRLTHQTEISGYRALRLLELNLVGKADPRVLDDLPSHDALAIAWAHICDPRGYPDKPKWQDPSWISKVANLAEQRFSIAS